METPALGKGEVMYAGDIHSASRRALGIRLSPLDEPLSARLCSRWPVTKMGSEGDAGSGGCMTLGQLLKCKGMMCVTISKSLSLSSDSLLLIPHLLKISKPAPKISPPPPSPLPLTVPELRVPLLKLRQQVTPAPRRLLTLTTAQGPAKTPSPSALPPQSLLGQPLCPQRGSSCLTLGLSPLPCRGAADRRTCCLHL